MVAPGQGSSEDGEQLLPLDGDCLGEQLVRLPRVVEPVAQEERSTAQGPWGVGVEAQVRGRDAAGVNKVCGAVPGGEELGPPGEVCPGLPAESDPVVELTDCGAQCDEPSKE